MGLVRDKNSFKSFKKVLRIENILDARQVLRLTMERIFFFIIKNKFKVKFSFTNS